jgi:hypothetical protein
LLALTLALLAATAARARTVVESAEGGAQQEPEAVAIALPCRVTLRAPPRAEVAARVLEEELAGRFAADAAAAPCEVALVQRGASDYASCDAAGFVLETWRVEGGGVRVVVEAGCARALLFGVGRLLRLAAMTGGSSSTAAARGVARDAPRLPVPLRLRSAPDYPLRSQMITYRALSNAYDAWNTTQMDRYIRDLALYGTNQMEFIAPDTNPSPHFPLPPQQMLEACAAITASYDLNVSLWYPFYPSDPAFGAIWHNLTRLDSLFVPGGDPGGAEPSVVFGAVDKAVRGDLWQRFPGAQVWLSNQGYNSSWNDEFYSLVDKLRPVWLTGVVWGPHTRDPLDVARSRLPPGTPIRHYPDVCHMLDAQFAQPNWTAPFAMTEQREFVNPLPQHERTIFAQLVPGTVGFGAYSDGATDDFNMLLWAALGWDQELDLDSALLEYARVFVLDAPADAAAFARVLAAAERHWQGSPPNATLIAESLQTMLQLRAHLTPAQYASNWRFQMMLYRVHYDAYAVRRWAREQAAETQALAVLARAPSLGSQSAMQQAAALLTAASNQTVRDQDPDRAACFAVAADLYASIGMQLSVPLYAAWSIGRGASLDTIDNPLSNAPFLLQQFGVIATLPTEPQRLAALLALVNWRNPTGDALYDNLGDIAQQPHLVTGAGFARDPAFYASALVGFAEPFNASAEPVWPFAWYSWAGSFYDEPLSLHYVGLDASAGPYTLQFVFGYGNPGALMQLVADDNYTVHGFIAKPQPPARLSFELPAALTADGELTLTWSVPPGGGGDGQGCQISEVWLFPSASARRAGHRRVSLAAPR